MKNQKLKTLVKKSNLLEIKEDFIIINQLDNIRGGEGGPVKPKLPPITFNAVCSTYNTRCTGIEIK
jgi:hypothetical protein